MGDIGRRARAELTDAAASTARHRRADLLAALWFVVGMVIVVAWAIAIAPITCAAVGATPLYPCPAGADLRQTGAALVTAGATICGVAATIGSSATSS